MIVGVLGMVFIGPLVTAADWVGARLDDPDGVLALAAFTSIFKLAGIVAFYPWIDAFSRLIVRLAGSGSDSAVGRLDPSLAEAGGAIALEAAWRAVLEVARNSVEAIRRRLAGEAVVYEPPVGSVRQIEEFLESLRLETTDLTTIAPRLVRLCHALDHLNQLHDDLGQIPPAANGWEPPAAFAAGDRALAAWLDATTDPREMPEPAILASLAAAESRLRVERGTSREQLLQDVAFQRVPTALARTALDTLAWAESTMHDAWRLADSLRIAARGGPPLEGDRRHAPTSPGR